MDSGAVFCDYLPIAFMNSGKKDWKVRAYPGYEHNFFETDSNGSPVVYAGLNNQVALFQDYSQKTENGKKKSK